MESKRTATKKVIKSGGRKKKEPMVEVEGSIAKEKGEQMVEVKGSIAKEKAEPMVEVDRSIVVENLGGDPGTEHQERLKGICLPIAPHISKDFHYALLHIPNHAIHDLGYIHFHLFTVWFFSKFNIPIPNDLHAIYISHFSLFPFFSALFHIRNNF